MGFAACTNEVEEFATQTPNFEGVELSEDFTISVKNSDFAASAETRAILNKVEKKWIAEWEENDAVGAAWFDKVALAENGDVTKSVSVYNALGEYGSNAEFKWMGDAIFKSEAVSKAGAYVLYYPYNEDLTDNFVDIPVKEIKSPQPFNCADVDAQVSENIFAANVVEFQKGQRNQAPVFTIEQIPNLYAVSFFIDDEALLKLDKEMEITQIMLEVTNGDAAAINTNGKVYPNIDIDNNGVLDYNIPAADYNADKMPAIGFEGDAATRISRMVISVSNTEKDSKYYITDLGQDNGTDRFYFSMLPTAVFDKVTFKIVGKIGGKTKVFARTYTASGTGLPTAYSAFDKLQTLMTGTGQVVELPVKLNYEDSTEDGIYSEEQFVESWNAGETNFNIQSELNLTDYAEQLNFILGDDAEVTFKGLPVTLPSSISGNYTFENDVKVMGDANLVGGTVNGNIEVTGNLTADGVKFNAPVVVGDGTKGTGNFTSKSAVTFKKPSSIKGNVTVENGTLSVPSKTVIGGSVTVKAGTLKASGTTITKNLTINKNAIATLSGTWSVSAVTVKGSLENNGKATINGKVTVYNTGVLKDKATSSLEKLGSLVVNEDAASVEINAKVVEAGTITANAPVTFNNTVGTVGDVTANAAVTFGNNVETVGNITATKDVTFNGTVTSVANIGTADVPATGKVSFNGAAKSIASITTKAPVNFTEATIEGNLSVTGEGVEVNADNLTVNGTVDLNEQVTLTAPTLTANAIELDTYCQLTANTKLEVRGLLNATGKVNAAGESKITTLTIEPNVVVDLAKANINTLNVNKKLTYVGTLNATNLTVAGGVNNGVINATSTTIIGAFTQSATLNTDAITVAKDTENNIHGNLTINADMDKAITNKGTVTVKAEKSVTTTSFINDGEIIVEGTVSKVTNNVNAKVTVKNGGNFTINGKNNGSIYLENGAITSKITNDANGKTIYKWSDAAPEATIIGKINALELDGVTLGDTYASIYKKALTVDVKGTITVPENANLYAWTINVVDNAQFTTPTESTVTIKTVNVKENKTLGTAEITILVGKSDIEPATITLGKGATFNGNKGANVNVTM